MANPQERELAVLEQITMVLTAQPVPPLGIRIKDSEEKTATTTSHDILATLLLAAMRRADPSLDQNRRKLQVEAMDRFIKASELILAEYEKEQEVKPDKKEDHHDDDKHKDADSKNSIGGSKAVPRMYEAYQRFAADCINSFDDPGHAPKDSFTFFTLEEMTPDTKVYKATRSWMVAQRILHENNNGDDANNNKNNSRSGTGHKEEERTQEEGHHNPSPITTAEEPQQQQRAILLAATSYPQLLRAHMDWILQLGKVPPIH